jgi:hypothetical protein
VCFGRNDEQHSAKITAGSLFEAPVVGMDAMKVPDWFNRSTLTIEIRVKSPETIHTVSNAVLDGEVGPPRSSARRAQAHTPGPRTVALALRDGF